MRRRWTAVTAVLVTVLVPAACSDDDPDAADRVTTSSTTSTSSSTTTTRVVGQPGEAGIGDPLTPLAGNGGYDVAHYRVELDATRLGGELVGTTTIEATATQALSAFQLDLSGFTVDGVTVAGADAGHDRFGTELRITPAAVITDGTAFTTVVRYHGVPQPVPDPSAPGEIGWLTGESGSFVVSEPVGAMGVFPGNDHPSDKATFDIVVTAPTTDTVVANGEQTDRRDAGGATTWAFEMTEPMATYLLQVAIGAYTVAEATAPTAVAPGIPLRSVAPAGSSIDLAAVNQRAAAQIAWFEPFFGDYPFDVYGLLIADAPPTFALETQTLSIFPASWYQGIPVESIEAHELAHQWFGDHVSVAQWDDMWLNEGFATYAEWMWDEHTGHGAVAERAAATMSAARGWRQRFGAVAAPRPGELFSPNQYDGAAIVLHALRRTIGDDSFFSLLRTWVERYGGANATTADFEALATEIAGQDLSGFFAAWLHSTTLPPLPPG